MTPVLEMHPLFEKHTIPVKKQYLAHCLITKVFRYFPFYCIPSNNSTKNLTYLKVKKSL